MTTIVNSPTPASTEDTSGVSMILGILVGVLIVLFLVIYGLPYLNRNMQPDTTAQPILQVNVPSAAPSNSGNTQSAE